MIRRALAVFSLIACCLTPAAAQERVKVGTMQSVSSGVFFLAAIKDYFKAEGLEVDITAYASDQDVVQALAAGATDFGVAGFTVPAFDYASRGLIKAVAGQAREKRDFEGSDLIVSNAAYARGQQKAEQLANSVAAVSALGASDHYQFGRIARLKGFDIRSVTLKPQGSFSNVARAVSEGQVDAAVLPGAYARALLLANQAKLVGWYSEMDEVQLGALFASGQVIAKRRATVEKFVRAYRRAAADYNITLMRKDKYGKRVSNAQSRETATAIARYVFPGRSTGASAVEADAFYIDAQARLDADDIARQVEWYRAQGLLDRSVDPRAIVDQSF
jgi:NitT/TauT family transport system substrate-binding protein